MIRPRAAGANMSVDVDVAVNLEIPGADSSLPRIDRIVREAGRVRCICGTPTAGATLFNRYGLACEPENAETVALVVVQPAAAAIQTEHISFLHTPAMDRRIAALEAEADNV